MPSMPSAAFLCEKTLWMQFAEPPKIIYPWTRHHCYQLTSSMQFFNPQSFFHHATMLSMQFVTFLSFSFQARQIFESRSSLLSLFQWLGLHLISTTQFFRLRFQLCLPGAFIVNWQILAKSGADFLNFLLLPRPCVVLKSDCFIWVAPLPSFSTPSRQLSVHLFSFSLSRRYALLSCALFLLQRYLEPLCYQRRNCYPLCTTDVLRQASLPQSPVFFSPTSPCSVGSPQLTVLAQLS
jgi:hypothetical protein